MYVELKLVAITSLIPIKYLFLFMFREHSLRVSFVEKDESSCKGKERILSILLK